MALVRTDYGLIYNTDGSLCATLLPEGCVAVEEGTVNLVNNPTEWIVESSQYQESVDTGEKFLGCRVTKTTKLSTGSPPTELYRLSIANGEVYTASVYVKITQKGNLDGARLVFYNNNASQILTQTFSSKVGEWERLEVTYANNTGSTLDGVRVLYYPSRDVGDITYTAAPQLEQKPLATSFVDGTRAAGRLEYPGVFQQGTISAWVYLDKEFLQSLPTTDSRCLLWGNATSGNTERTAFFYYWRSGRILRYRVVQADGTGSDIDAPVPETGWHHFVTIMHGDKMALYIDGEKVNEIEINVPMPSNNILQVGSASTGGHGNFLIDELLICPYAVSPETVATWHSLDAPFFDPREITTAELAAKEYAEAQAELARVTAEAYADGKVTAEEQARIAEAQQKLQEAKEYADQKAAEDINASKRKIYAPGVIINSTGAWGIANGIKQAGFGTDGKWVAGGGSVVADADGLIGKDPDTDEVKFKIGTNGKVEVLEIYSDMYKEIRNVLPYNYLDSLDADNPLICDFYIPSETENIVSVKLSAKGLPFRAYAKGSRSGGATVETSAFGGGHTHSLHNVELSTEGYHNHSGSTSTTGSHNHSISSSLTFTSNDYHPSGTIKRTGDAGRTGEPVGLHSHSIGGFDGASISGHTHEYYKADSTSSTGNHKHTISSDGRHTHTISSFSLVEGGSHTHKITIPGHTHDLIFGIYEDTSPANVVLWIDNGSGFNTSINLGSNEILAEELDITQYVTGTGWKRLKFTSSRLGRINAQLIVKVDLTA